MKEQELQLKSMKYIFEKIGFGLHIQDIISSINLDADGGKRAAEEFREECPEMNDDNYAKFAMLFMMRNQELFDKTSIVMMTLENYNQEIERFEIKPNEETREGYEEIKDKSENAKKLLAGIDKKISRVIEDDKGKISLNILSTRDLTLEKKSTKNIQKLEELRSKGIQLGEVLNSMIFTDLDNVICGQEFGQLLRYQCFHNTAIRKGINYKSQNIFDPEYEIEKLRDKIEFKEVLPEMERAILDNIEYLDFNKLVLDSAYRYIEYLEKNENSDENEKEEVMRRVKKIREYLKDKTARIEGKIENGRYQEDNDDISYNTISYRVKDFLRDMEKLSGNTYWGQAKIEAVKNSLLVGETTLNDLGDDFNRIRLSKEEVMFLASSNDENYVFLLNKGLLKKEEVSKINSTKTSISGDCIQIQLQQELLEEETIIQMYLQGKVPIEDMLKTSINFENSLKPEVIYEEYIKENNDERKEKISLLYRRLLDIPEERKKELIEQRKQKVFDIYLENENTKYLEVFYELGTIQLNDLQGVMSGKEWTDVLNNGEISKAFYIQLRENGMVKTEDIKQDKKSLELQLKLWEEGKLSKDIIVELEIEPEQLFQMCEEGKIKGTRIGELLKKEEIKKQGSKLLSSYAYGQFETMRPAFAAYNSNIINRDSFIKLAEQMKMSSKDATALCEEGLFTDGTKIAELRYKGVITKGQFKKLKENGLVTDEEEIKVVNNLTPEEMINELKESGFTTISNMGEILTNMEESREKKDIKPKPSLPNLTNKKIINPLKRMDMFSILGGDTIQETPKIGFKGYQAILFPNLGIAILEKLFRERKNGDTIPTYGDGTYICEIGKLIQIAGQSKTEIREFMDTEGNNNGKVKVVQHFKNWGKKLIDSIVQVNENVKIKKDEREKITEISVGEKETNIDIKELNNLIEQIKNGEYSLSLEDYL